MLYQDLQSAPTSDRIFDVCIVGSGPAGVSLARNLARHGLDIALMEAGDVDFTARSQRVYQGEIVGLDYYDPEISRLRYFGGSSNHWGGRCRGLDAVDFEPKPYLPLSGWPIGKADLDPYAAAVEEILELAPGDRFADSPLEGTPLREIFYRQSPVRFNAKYRAELTAAPRIHVVLNANLVDLRLEDGLRAVAGAVFRSYAPDGPERTIRARRYCLCLGGLENPRFLLNARSQIPVGIGNEHDLVGRFFCEHPHFVIGDVLFRDEVPLRKSYSASAAFLAEEEALNFAVRVITGKLGFVHEAGRTVICSTDFTERLVRRVLGRTIDCDFGGMSEYFRQRRHHEDDPTGTIQINSEQQLNRDSRILLTGERDRFGLQRLAVDWHLTETDLHTMRVAGELIGRQMAARELGRVRLRDWVLDPTLPLPGVSDVMVGGHHHMCTTRMSENPREGVVDRDCRVHGLKNLYIGGSSVFATSGHANPTYTIVQLALRLGDHLAGILVKN